MQRGGNDPHRCTKTYVWVNEKSINVKGSPKVNTVRKNRAVFLA